MPITCAVPVFPATAYSAPENAWAAVQNNALGTLRLTEAISNYPVSQLVFISTDKAVNPTNVMGATKRMAEIVLQGLQQRSLGTRFSLVRFRFTFFRPNSRLATSPVLRSATSQSLA
jgi:FlaA1/EpsC-like NDP-sugar epimerase